MSEQGKRMAQALENIEHQLLALNEWLVRYGETRLDPPLPSPGIHLIKFRELTEEEREYGRRLAGELEAELRAEVLRTLLHCEPMFRLVTCASVPEEGSGWLIEVDDEDSGVGYMTRQSDGRAHQFVGATVGKVNLEDPDNEDEGWIWLRRFYDGKVFDCRLIVAEEEEPAGGRLGGEEERG